MATNVFALFDTRIAAQHAIDDILQLNIQPSDISVVSGEAEGEGEEAFEQAGGGASTGAMVGGGLGIVAGLTALALPGIGLILAAGPLAAGIGAVAAGAASDDAAGQLRSTLTEAGLSEEQAQRYVEGVRSGGTLVAVATDASQGDAVADTFKRRGSKF